MPELKKEDAHKETVLQRDLVVAARATSDLPVS